MDTGAKAYKLMDPDDPDNIVVRGMVKFKEDSFTAAKGIQESEEILPLDTAFNTQSPPGNMYQSDQQLPDDIKFF